MNYIFPREIFEDYADANGVFVEVTSRGVPYAGLTGEEHAPYVWMIAESIADAHELDASAVFDQIEARWVSVYLGGKLTDVYMLTVELV